MSSSTWTVEHMFEAARLGDWKWLQEALDCQPTEYLLSEKQDEGNCNIIHIAASQLSSDSEDDEFNHKLIMFMQTALKKLPGEAAASLLCAKEKTYEQTPLHFAALRGSFLAIKLLVDIYKHKSAGDGDRCHLPPWLLKNQFKETPLHVLLKNRGASDDEKQFTAVYLLFLDMENLCNSVDASCDTPLSLAVRSGCDHVVKEILESGCQYSLTGPDGFTLLHLASSVQVCRLLLEKHPELPMRTIEETNTKGWSVLHSWAVLEYGVKLLEFLSKFDNNFVIRMTDLLDPKGRSPLHVACAHDNFEFADKLYSIYKASTSSEPQNNSTVCSVWEMQDDEFADELNSIYSASNSFEQKNNPTVGSLWEMKDDDGNTPLHLALASKQLKGRIPLKVMSAHPNIVHVRNNAGESLLFIAVQHGVESVVDTILQLPDPDLIGMPVRNNGDTVLHVMCNYSARAGELLVEKFWWLINSVNSKGKTPSEAAKEANVLWAERLLSTRRHSNPSRAIFDWILASEKGHSQAVIAFISHCRGFMRICREKRDTPLHHIQLKSFKEYEDFLANPIVDRMKNMRDGEGATPLHRALERKDIHLAELLLATDGVDLNVPDRSGITPSDLLVQLCCQHPHEWGKMCESIEINPWVRPKYLESTKTNVAEMRQTLSVVAALLATLTFAAGFTIPGGFDSKSGEAIVAKKAAFLVFILADTVAMCTSLLTLFCLIWSMVCRDREKSIILVDHSVVILMVALYGTLLAFMSGVFTVIYTKSLWAAIVICVICSLVGISANKTLLFKVLNRLVPAVNPEHRDEFHIMEQGKAFLCCRGGTQKAD